MRPIISTSINQSSEAKIRKKVTRTIKKKLKVTKDKQLSKSIAPSSRITMAEIVCPSKCFHSFIQSLRDKKQTSETGPVRCNGTSLISRQFILIEECVLTNAARFSRKKKMQKRIAPELSEL